MIVPEWVEPEVPAFVGPDAGLPTLYEFVESAGPFIGRARPPAAFSPPPPSAQTAVAEAPAAVAEESPDSRSPSEPDAPAAPSVLRQLALVPDVEGPHVRLALLWAVGTAGAAVVGRYWLATWLAAAALLAGGQVVRSWRRRPVRPTAAVVVFGAAAVPIAAAVGTAALAGVAGVVIVAAVVGPLVEAPGRGGRRSNPALTLALALGIGLAAASPVMVRQRGLVPTLVLLTLIGVYDASAYVVGAGSSNPWEGPAAGVAFMAAVTLAVAAIFVPPFTGATPWVLGAVALVLAPLGPLIGALLLGDRDAPAQALRRLDSLLIAGPVWAAAALILLKS